jgi:drug/metabolite transporter (DMT)-like permease
MQNMRPFALTGLITAYITLLVTSQIMYKFAGLWSLSHPGPGLLGTAFKNPWIAMGLGSAMIAMVLWLMILRQLSLTEAYPWTALIYIITPIASTIIFGELLKPQYFLGLALVIVGVFIATRPLRGQ